MITLRAIMKMMFDRFEVGKVLVIGPLRVCTGVWPAELVAFQIDRGERLGKFYYGYRERFFISGAGDQPGPGDRQQDHDGGTVAGHRDKDNIRPSQGSGRRREVLAGTGGDDCEDRGYGAGDQRGH